jgi:hypothetical protein
MAEFIRRTWTLLRVFYANGKDRAFLPPLHHYIAPLKSAVLSQPPLKVSNASHLNQVLELLRTLMEYRSAEVRQRLEKVGREASMLHTDVLLLIYHFARFGAGNVLEIGPYIGGSTIAAAFGARESGMEKKIITIEAGGSVKHFRLSSRIHHQGFEKEPRAVRRSRRRYLDQRALLGRGNHLKSSSALKQPRSEPIYFRRGQ